MSLESNGFLVVLAVFKTAVVPPCAGEAGSIPALSGLLESMKLRRRGRMVERCFLTRMSLLACLALMGCAGSTGSSGGVWAVNFIGAESAAAHIRSFLFNYSATVTGLQPNQSARVWLPVPTSGIDQDVEIISSEGMVPLRFTHEVKYGNRLAYLEAKANADGNIPVDIVYRISRREVGESAAVSTVDAKYLQADALVPLGGKPLLLLADQSLPHDQLAEARMLYNVVDDHLQYRKDRPGWGRGDAVWACESGFGNCTDFHSLFISLCRSQGIPSTFEIGFSIPEKHGSGEVSGYHCWAKFKPAGHGWVPVDISEANQNPGRREYFFGHLCQNRVAFSTGRDLILEPHQAGPPVNFLVYPYVEVEGHPYPAERIEHHFSYENVP
jgi:hypothetical protein